MKITKKLKRKRLLLELDDSENLYITEDTIVRFMLSKGMEITEQELKEIQTRPIFLWKKSQPSTISPSNRAARKLRTIIQLWHPTEHHQPSLGRLKKDNWINDRKYANSYIQSTFSLVIKALLFSSKNSAKGFLALLLSKNRTIWFSLN